MKIYKLFQSQKKKKINASPDSFFLYLILSYYKVSVPHYEKKKLLLKLKLLTIILFRGLGLDSRAKSIKSDF